MPHAEGPPRRGRPRHVSHATRRRSSARPAPRAPARSRLRVPARRQTGRRLDAGVYRQIAQNRLKRLRQGSVLAVALTAMLLLVWGVPPDVEGRTAGQPALPAQQEPAAPPAVPDPAVAVAEATTTIRELAYGFYAFLPRLLLVLLLVGLAAVVAKLARSVLERTLRGWERTAALTAITRLVVFLVAAVAALSILTGDVRAIVGSLGLLGLAASWALQTPIESFTGWLLNSFRGYYRVGDRIAVGDVFGDVFRIDVLTTTVWEAGGAGKPVAAAQSTGALITFPNWEVLRSNVVNYSRDFPFVWDEVTIGVANESDLPYTVDVLERTARAVLGREMEDAAQRYEQLLRSERLLFDVDEVPRVYLSLADSWIDCTIRYLVPVRSRRRWSTALILATSAELARPEHRDRILGAYPRTEVALRHDWPGAPQAGPSPAP